MLVCVNYRKTAKMNYEKDSIFVRYLMRCESNIENGENNNSIKWGNDFLNMTSILGKRSHCVSHGVAAFITKDCRIISTGINGTPKGLINCDAFFDKNNFDKEKHHEFSLNYEIHAEVNALLSAARNGICIDNSDIYVNYSPCRDCAKAILASGIKSLYFRDLYMNDLNGFLLLLLSGIVKVNQIIEDDDLNAINEKMNKTLHIINEALSKFDNGMNIFSDY